MSPEEINLAIAEFCGWKFDPRPEVVERFSEWKTASKWCLDENGHNRMLHDVTNYFGDLNAIHKAVGTFYPSQALKWCDHLREIVCEDDHSEESKSFWLIQATAAQRCEALLKTIGKWKD